MIGRAARAATGAVVVTAVVAVVAVVAAIAVVGCSRRAVPAPAGAASDAGGPPRADRDHANDSNADAPNADAPNADGPNTEPRRAEASDPGVEPPAGLGEARRTRVARLDAEPLLKPHAAAVRDHFGADAGGPFAIQRVELVGGRTALLVSRADGDDPMVLVVDRDRLAWTKPRPTAGILPPVRHLTIAPGPEGGVVVFGWVAALRTVAARMWADDANPFGDFGLFAAEACDALSAAALRGGGWVVACATSAGTRAQRLRQDITVAWGAAGAPIGAPSAVGPATLVADSSSTFVLVQRAAAVGGDRLLAFRYDLQARPLWGAPVDLGTVAGAAPAEDRAVATAEESGVRVEWPRGPLGGRGRAVEVTPEGRVRPARP